MNNQELESLISIHTQLYICTIGIVLNIFLTYVIAKNKELRSVSGLFLLAMAINDAISEFSLASLPVVLSFAHLTIPLPTCFHLSAYGPYAQSVVPLLMLQISLDRFYALAFPISYKWISSKHKWSYFLSMLALFYTISLHQLYLQFIYVQSQNASKKVSCVPGDFITGITNDLRLYTNIVCSSGAILGYVLMWIYLRVSGQADQDTTRRVSHSLFTLTAIIVTLWLPAPIILNQIIPQLDERGTARLVLRIAAKQSNKVAQAINAPILFLCSKTYRLAMQAELKKVFRHINSTSTQIHPAEAAVSGNHYFRQQTHRPPISRTLQVERFKIANDANENNNDNNRAQQHSPYSRYNFC